LSVWLLQKGHVVKQESDSRQQLARGLVGLREQIFKLEASASRRKRVEERLKRLNLMLRAIRSVNQLIVREKDRDRLLKGACTKLTKTRGYYHTWIALLDTSGSVLTTAEAGLGKDFLPMVERLKRGKLPACGQKALAQSAVVVTTDPSSACTDCPLVDRCDGRGAMVIRLKYGGKVCGLLSVSMPAALTADEEERSLFMEIAGDITFSLHNMKLEEERKQTGQQLRESELRYRTIFEATGTATVIIEEDTTLSMVNTEFEKLSGYSRKELEGKKSWTEFVAKDDLDRMKEYHRLRRVDPSVAPTNYEFQFIDRQGNWKDTFLTISMIPGTKQSVASLLDITERKRAEQALGEGYEKLQRSLEGTIQAMARVVEARDPYTAGHQRRVSQLACAIAEEMGLSEEQIRGIHMAGLIHDIGKIHVPSEILAYPDRLSAAEFNIIQTHPQVGYEILKAIEFPWPIAQIVLQHHERMDGSGYPQGLSGEDILLEARILGVADVVEAMSSHRPYRPAHGVDKALLEILQNRGRLYDPGVVDACSALFVRKRFKFK